MQALTNTHTLNRHTQGRSPHSGFTNTNKQRQAQQRRRCPDKHDATPRTKVKRESGGWGGGRAGHNVKRRDCVRAVGVKGGKRMGLELIIK